MQNLKQMHIGTILTPGLPAGQCQLLMFMYVIGKLLVISYTLQISYQNNKLIHLLMNEYNMHDIVAPFAIEWTRSK